MDQTNDGWGPTVSGTDPSAVTPSPSTTVTPPAPATDDTVGKASAQPGMLAYVNSLMSNGVSSTDAMKMAMRIPAYANSKFSFSPSADGKSFVDNSTASAGGSSSDGWGPSVHAHGVDPSNTITRNPPTLGAKISGTAILAYQDQMADAKQALKGDAADLPVIAKTAMDTIKQDVSNNFSGKNLPQRYMTPQEADAAKALGYISGNDAAVFQTMAPAGQKHPTLDLPDKDNWLGQLLTESAPANIAKGMFTATQQERVKYNNIQSYIKQSAILADPKASPEDKAQAQDNLDLLKEPSESLKGDFDKIAKAYSNDPTGTIKALGEGIFKSIRVDPELLLIGGGSAGVTALSDAAKAAGASAKTITALKLLEHTVTGAGEGAGLNAGIAAAKGVSSPTGQAAPGAIQTAAEQGAGLGAVLGAARSPKARAQPETLTPDTDSPGWSKPISGNDIGPVNPPGGSPTGGGQGKYTATVIPPDRLTTDHVAPEQSGTAQLRMGKPGDVNAPHEPGQPIATNTPIDDTGTIPLTGGTSEDLKGLHVDKDFPSTKELTNQAGQKVTLPVKDIVTQVHEAEEAPLMHPQGPVPIEKIHDLMDRAGSFATAKIFSPTILKDIADGTPLSYSDAHNIATAIENHHVESNYNVKAKDYQDSLLPHIKQIEERAKGEPASDIPATLGNKPYDDSGLGDQVEGQSKPSVGGLPAGDEEGWGKPVENNASGESSASMEAINRLQQERANGQERYLINRDGSVEPVIGVDGVDKVARPGQVIVQKNVGVHKWTILSHGDDVSPDMAKGYVNKAADKLSQAGKVDPKLLLALGVGAAGALAGAYLYQKHPVEGAVIGFLTAPSIVRAFKYIPELTNDLMHSDKNINISDMIGKHQEAIKTQQLHMYQLEARGKALVPKAIDREKITYWLDGEKNNKLNPNELNLAKQLESYFAMFGNLGVSTGVLHDTVRDYVTHIIKGKMSPADISDIIGKVQQKGGGASSFTPFSKDRTFASIRQIEAAGYTLATKDPLVIARIYGQSMIKAMANKVLIDTLKRTPSYDIYPSNRVDKAGNTVPGTSGNMLIMPASKAPADYVINPRMPGVKVNPRIKSQLNMLFDFHEPSALNVVASSLNTAHKALMVALSPVHLANLAFAHYGASGVHAVRATGEIFRALAGKGQGMQYLKTAGPNDPIALGIRAGLNLQLNPDEGIDPDYYQDFKEGMNMASTAMENVFPGIGGKVIKGMSIIHEESGKFIFGRVMTSMMADTFLNNYEALQKSWAAVAEKKPGTAIPPKEHLAAQAASATNDFYGAPNYINMSYESATDIGRVLAFAANSPASRRTIQYLDFAPAWLISQVRSFSKAVDLGQGIADLTGNKTIARQQKFIGGTKFKGLASPKTGVDIRRRYQISTILQYLLIAGAIQYNATGTSILANKDPTRIQYANGQQSEFNPHGMGIYAAMQHPEQFAINKMNFLPRELLELLTNQEYLSAKGHAPPYSGIGNHIEQELIPFTANSFKGVDNPLQFLTGLIMPRFGETMEEKATRAKAGVEKAKETRKEHLSKDPLYYYHKREAARERRMRGD